MPRNSAVARIPNSWNNYSMAGFMSQGTVRFAFFKTPVKRKGLSPEELVTQLTKNGCKLGLVIDLTDTHKYYNPNEFVALNVVHYKIPCVGMKVPDEDIVEHFHLVVSRYFQQHSHEKKYVGVHCFNGVNRTGYLICRYLIDVLHVDVLKAINMFQEHRGHEIEHDCIRNSLLEHTASGKTRCEEKKKCILM